MAKPDRQPQDQQSAQIAALERQLVAAQRLQIVMRARENLLDFATLMMPDPEFPDDPTKTRFKIAPHHILIGEALRRVMLGTVSRLAISMPPRHGKSEEATRLFPAHCIGANPYWQIILAGATAEFAREEFGRKIRGYMETPAYKQIFPGASLRGGSRAVDAITTREGGNIKSIGKGGQVVGRGADLFVIDDPYSGREEAYSATERRKVWDWFTSDVISRMMPGGRIVVIHQRWHEDDLIGRLTDPLHPEHNPKVTGKWMHLYLPAIVYDEELARLLGVELSVPEDPEHRIMFGNRPSRPLWPERYSYDFFAEIKSQNASAFEALYMGNPTPDDGEFFKREHIVPHMYNPNELPRNLRYYAASDHAVSLEQNRDPTCIIIAGVDEEGTLWIVDCVWRQMETDVAAEAMLEIGARYKPLIWWAEKPHYQAIRPFLRKMMKEQNNYLNIHEVVAVSDKMTRAQSIQARISQGRVRFPMHAPWMQAALDEMLKFPMARHDDFVDALAHLGRGLDRQTVATKALPKLTGPKTGTLAWVKASDRERRKLENLRMSKYR